MTNLPDKSKLRKASLDARLRITPDEAKVASLALARQLVRVIPSSAIVIAGYRPVRGEIDVTEALMQLAERGHTLCLPVITSPSPLVGEGRGEGVSLENALAKKPPPPAPSHKGRGNILVFRRWKLSDTLEMGKYGIETPPASEPQLIPDVVLVPLVAFDANGHRLGYGAGYYDTTLTHLRRTGKPLIIGVAFACQQVDAIPSEPHDARLDAVVTENSTLQWH